MLIPGLMMDSALAVVAKLSSRTGYVHPSHLSAFFLFDQQALVNPQLPYPNSFDSPGSIRFWHRVFIVTHNETEEHFAAHARSVWSNLICTGELDADPFMALNGFTRFASLGFAGRHMLNGYYLVGNDPVPRLIRSMEPLFKVFRRAGAAYARPFENALIDSYRDVSRYGVKKATVRFHRRLKWAFRRSWLRHAWHNLVSGLRGLPIMMVPADNARNKPLWEHMILNGRPKLIPLSDNCAAVINLKERLGVIIDAKTSQIIKTLRIPKQWTGLSDIALAGKYVVGIHRNILYRCDSRELLKIDATNQFLGLGKQPLSSVIAAQDGKTIVALSQQEPNPAAKKPSVIIWDGESFESAFVIYGKAKKMARLSREGRWLFTLGMTGRVSAWIIPQDTQPNFGLVELKQPARTFYPDSQGELPMLHDMAISQDGRWLATLDNAFIQLYDTSQYDMRSRHGVPQATLPIPQEPGKKISGFCISADGRFAVTGHADAKVRLWDIEHREFKAVFGFAQKKQTPITSVWMTEDLILAGSESGYTAWKMPQVMRNSRRQDRDLLLLPPVVDSVQVDVSSEPDPMKRSPEYQSLLRLGMKERWRYWSLVEIRQWLGRRSIHMSRNMLRKLVNQRIIKSRPNGLEREYRIPWSDIDRQTPAGQEDWGGRLKERIPEDPDFRTAGSRRMMEYIFGRTYVSPGQEEPIARQVVLELLASYDHLRKEGAFSTKALLKTLQDQFGSALTLHSEELLEKGMHWLDLKGRPLRHVWIENGKNGEISGWQVQGLAAQRNINLDVDTWPEWAREKWKVLAKETKETRKTTVARFEVILAVNAIDLPDMDRKARTLFTKWRHSELPTHDCPAYDQIIKKYTDSLGIHPAWVRFGDCPTALEEVWIPAFPGMGVGERAWRLRMLEGYDFHEAARRTGINIQALQPLELLVDFPRGTQPTGMRKLPHTSRWPALAKAYHRDSFLIVVGVTQGKIFNQGLDQADLYRRMRLAFGYNRPRMVHVLVISMKAAKAWDRFGPRGILLTDVLRVLTGEADATLIQRKRAELAAKAA